MNWKVVSFDFDNTIGYADPPINITLSKILERADIIVDPERLREIRQMNATVHPLLSHRGWGARAIPFYYRHGFRIVGFNQDQYGIGHDAITLKKII